MPTMAGRGLRTKLLYWRVGCFQGGNTRPQPKRVVAYALEREYAFRS